MVSCRLFFSNGPSFAAGNPNNNDHLTDVMQPATPAAGPSLGARSSRVKHLPTPSFQELLIFCNINCHNQRCLDPSRWGCLDKLHDVSP